MGMMTVTPPTENLRVGLMLSRKTAARLLELSEHTIDRAIQAGELQAFKVGRRVLIPPDKLIEFAQRAQVGRA